MELQVGGGMGVGRWVVIEKGGGKQNGFREVLFLPLA